jgi:hypothetical protein
MEALGKTIANKWKMKSKEKREAILKSADPELYQEQ